MTLDIVHQNLITDTDLIDKTKMTPDEVIELLQICVGEVYFVFNKKLYANKGVSHRIFFIRFYGRYIYGNN
jgi:hypothetical protein